MTLQTATDKVTTGVRNLTDDVLQSAQDAVQTTRAAADQSLDKAEVSVRALRRQADPAIDDLAARAQDLAARSIDYCAETSARARRQMQQAAEATSKNVAEQPGNPLLERPDGRILAEDVIAHLGLRHRVPHGGCGTSEGVGQQVRDDLSHARASRRRGRRVRGSAGG